MSAACSDGDSSASPEDDGAPTGTETTERSERSTTTQPSATDDEETVHALVEDLVLEATGLADDLFQDPAAVDDPDDEQIDRLRQLYTDDSPTPEAVEDQLRDLAADGHKVRAAASGFFRNVSIYDVTTVDADTVRFRVCVVEDQETVDAGGGVVETTAHVAQGNGEARRVDGVWRFYGVNPDDDPPLELQPGQANPDACETVAGVAEEGQGS